MIDAIIQQLRRTSSGSERAELANKLCEEVSDEAVAELIRMVEGRFRAWDEVRWRTLALPVPRFYSLDDQLKGLELLGLSKNSIADSYLLRNFHYCQRVIRVWSTYTVESVREDEYDPAAPLMGRNEAQKYYLIFHPGARGRLRKALSYIHDAEFKVDIRKNEEAHRILEEALDRCHRNSYSQYLNSQKSRKA